MTLIDDSATDGIDVADTPPEEAALTVLIELRDVGFGRHRAEVLVRHFGEVFETIEIAEEALEGLRARGLVAKSHSKGEFYYRATALALEVDREDGRS